MLIGRTPRFFASCFTRSRRRKLSGLRQHRTSSASVLSFGLARAKNPRAWLDQAINATCVLVNHARDLRSEAATHPGHTGSTMRARLKLLLTTVNPVSPFFLA